jgi:hypothetical protein
MKRAGFVVDLNSVLIYGDAHRIDEIDSLIEQYPSEPRSWERFCEISHISQSAVLFRGRILNYPHAAVEDRGLARDRKSLFANALLQERPMNSARWNRGIEWNLIETFNGLIRDATRNRR